MKVSIITSVWNNKETIEDAIKSVLLQNYPDIEYIIVDGASSDGTVNIIKKYEDQITTFVSEKDKGIYDGLNRGVSLATGDIIGFLHSDDIYADETIISNVVETFKSNDTDSIYGDLVYVDKKNTSKIFRYWKSGEYSYKKLTNGWMPPHPTFFVKREFYKKHGNFDLNFGIAADYDFMLRMLGKYKITTSYLPKVLYKMRVGGASNRSLKNIIQKSKEDIKALKNNGIGGWHTIVMKNLSKIPQFLKKK
ncbi:glycosyltransferase family 2 protein [Arcobacter sp. YIC-464]|uniref:glycosyltransferase family 2 protein n=1 Tax=Arcobacter sp. YIC-464 TaxID=3376631 RepID=UPI003C1C595A